MKKQCLTRNLASLCNSTALTSPVTAIGALAAIALSGGNAFALDANSLPTDGAVVSGAATFTQSGSKLNVNQSSNRTVIDWRSFDIGENAHVNFDQPNSGSIAVNRVNASTNASQINGQLTANGHVWVLNPNGVMFGKSARIDVAGLVASTGKIDTGRFMAGDTRLTVSSGNDGSVVNEGQITIREGGLAAFVAPAVRNNGIIQAKLGKVALAAGETFTLDLAGDQLVEIGLGLDGATAEQFGKILADGGRIEVSAKSAGGMIDSLINLAGVTSAASAEVKGGQIILGGDNIEISGTLDVSGVAGGGSIDIEGERITTTETADIRADSLDEGDGGTIVAYANIEGRYDGAFSAQGGPTRGNGGFVETSGKAVRISDGISVNTLAPEGKTGSWSIDPDELTVIETGGDGTSTIGADTIVTNLETTDVRIEASETINVDAEIDSSGQTNSSTLSLNDENDDRALVVNLNAAITMGTSQTLTGEASEVNVTDGASIQNGIDVSASGAIVNVAPGEYAETATYGGQTLGLVIDKSVTLQGISSTGDVIADREDVEATVISGGESNWGTNFYVTGSDVTITGLEFQAVSANTDVESSDVTINKAFEVTADNFVMEHSIVAAADGYDYDGDTSTALYFGDGGADDLNNFTLNDNQLHGGITITNGAGDGDEPVDFTITNNEFLGTHFLRVRGVVDGVGWLNASAHAPTTVTGNDVSAVTNYVAEIWGNDAADQVNAGFISNLVENNTMGNYAYALAEDGMLSFSDYTEYGGTAPAFFLEKTIQGAVGTANSGDTVLVGAGTYEEAVTVAAANITLSGAQAGVDARDRSGDETVLTGSIKVEGAADGAVIDGFTIVEGAVVEGSKVGIYIKRDATDVTIQNNLFTRSGDVDGDGYRGILTVSNGDQTGLLIQNNSFSGWATGAYLNPGAIGAQILNNDFNGNFVGVSVDGPDGAIISGNSFTNNVFEGLGLGPGADIPSAALTSNEFTGNTTHIGVYDDIKVDATSNIFDGTLASEMTTAQLLALEDKIGHGLDADYEGYVVTREGNVYVTQDSGSIQRAHDTIGAGSSLANQNIINVAPGDYTEGNAGVSMAGASGGQNFGLHLYHDNILVQGVDSAGNVITDATTTGATVTAEYQANFGAQHFVYGDGVSVTGLTFKPVEGGDNKTFEVIGDNFTMRNSVIDNSESVSGVALYMSEFGDVDGTYKDVESFTIEDNIFMAGPETYYTITFANGTGDDSSSENRIFSGNKIIGAEVSGVLPSYADQAGIRFNGIVPGVSWLTKNVGSVTIEGNTFSNLAAPVTSRGVGLPDLDFDAIFTNNIFEEGSALAYVGDTNVARSQEITYQGELVDYTVITRSITESLDVAQTGDTVLVGAGTYDPLRIDYGDPENITIDGQGVATISLDGTESLQRIVDLRADGTTFTGFNIDGGGTHVGISISGQNVTASENNIQNVLTGIQTTTQYTAGNNTITGNTITESGYGISLQNNSNVVTNNIIDVETEGMGIGSGDNTIAGNTFTVGSEGVHIQTYTTEDYDALPGADIDLLAALDDNNFSSATYVTDGTDITVQTIFGNIQSAIDVASSGNTVEIMEGVYEEDVVDTKKLAFAFSDAVLDGLTLNTDGSSISGTASSSVNGFTFNVDVVLDGDTSLTTTGDAGITTAAIDGASAGGQTLNISSSGPASIGSVGKTTRLGATDIGGTGAKTLTGDTYKADSLNFDGPVTLTQSLTSFNTTQSATAAGDITFIGDLFGTTSGEQNIVLIAGDGEGEASTNGDISLQSAGTETVKLGQMEVLGNDFSAATVYLADSFDAQQTGDQTFTQETLNADGNVTSTVGGNVNGPINSGGTATVSAGKSVVGSVTGAVVDVKAVTTVSGTVSGTTSVKVSANNIDATVTSQGTAEIDAVDSYNGTVTAAKSTINATVVDAVVNGGSSTIVANSGNVTGNANVDVEGGGALDVNGRKVIGSSEADFYQMVVEDYVLPEGAIVTTSGEIVLPKGLALGLISPPSDGSIEPKVILVRDVRALGSLLEQGYTAIVIDLNGTSDVDEETQLVMAE